MAPAILIVGATGNTGRGVTEALPPLLKANDALSNHRVIALTRSSASPAAQQLAKIPGVEVIEQNWTEITADWLREHQVVRAFIASHNAPNQFAEESAFHVAALNAGVEYVVRISTAAAAVRPDFGTYYARAHWAIEALLGSAEFGGRLKWTSLRPNVFTDVYLASAAQHVGHFRQTGGQQGTLRLLMDKEAPVAPNDPYEVGVLAARLLALADPGPHSGAKYAVNGPEDITGAQIVELVEQHIGTEVRDVVYRDISFVDALVANTPGQSRTLMGSMKYGIMSMWEDSYVAATTSEAVKEIGAPKRTPKEVLDRLLEQ